MENNNKDRISLIRSIMERRNKEKGIETPYILPTQYDIREEAEIVRRKAGEQIETVGADNLGISLAMSQIWGD